MTDGELQPALGTWEAIDTLRVVREFDPRPLEPWAVERVLDAGRRTGSSKNLQRWSFIVCRDRAHLAELATLGPWAGHLAGAAVAIALGDPAPGIGRRSAVGHVGPGARGAEHGPCGMGVGIGSVPATVYEHDPGARPAWAIRRSCTAVHPVPGLSRQPHVLTAPKRPGGRRPLAELVHQERW